MLRLRIISSPGKTYEIPCLPCVVGRGARSSVCLDKPGIWDEHFKLEQDSSGGFVAAPLGPAVVSLNGIDHKSGRIRNGDIIGVGGIELEFSFADPVQTDLRFREVMVWTLILLVTMGEIALLYWLLA